MRYLLVLGVLVMALGLGSVSIASAPTYQVVSASRTLSNAYAFGVGDMYEDVIYCPAGKLPTGGGILINGSGVQDEDGIVSSYPSRVNSDYADNGWVVKFRVDPESAAQAVYVISVVCVSA